MTKLDAISILNEADFRSIFIFVIQWKPTPPRHVATMNEELRLLKEMVAKVVKIASSSDSKLDMKRELEDARGTYTLKSRRMKLLAKRATAVPNIDDDLRCTRKLKSRTQLKKGPCPARPAPDATQNTRQIMMWTLALQRLALVCALGARVAAAACVPSSATSVPEYPVEENAFATDGLVESPAEAVTLRITPNELPDGYDASYACPYEDEDLLAWEDASTWTSGVVPANGEDVELPANTRVLLSGCSVTEGIIFGIITIPASSELVFADHDIVLNAQGIRVQGKLTLGAESCRLHSQINITLYGEKPATLPADPAYKGIAAIDGGTISVHGSIFHPTWSRLAATAAAGDSQLYLQHRVNWQPGQLLLVTGTELKDSRDWHRNEVRTITAVERSGNFARITLSLPLEYTHFGGVEYQGEVGLLSRNIVIQGDEASEPTDTENDVCAYSQFGTYPCEDKWLTGYGGHTMAAGEGSTIQMEGVQLYRMGQTNVLARYPWHVHLVGEGGHRSYLKHSSVYHSFFRCASVHGTNSTLIQDTVGYDVIGHCFYIAEDGVEENTTVAYNLGAHVHFLGFPQTSSNQYMDTLESNENLTQPADVTASPFYITRAYHRIIGNAASGGYA
ncbi:G8 domain-containing protein DDB_G0286311, partial [Hondaea fermentalgiana]